MSRGAVGIVSFALLCVVACSGKSGSSFDDQSDGGGAQGDGGSSGGPLGDGSSPGLNTDAGKPAPGDGDVSVATTIYANTDDSLYSMDPKTQAVTLIGKFAGVGGGTNDTNVTDLAVNANGDVYVNTESVVYKAAIPQTPGPVQLTKVATISTGVGQKFFALAFAPAGVLGAGEALVGGDGNGEVWSIDPTSGATKDLGSFGKDPAIPTKVFALSGDIVFYTDATNKPTGLATIRACALGGKNCDRTSDFLAGIDMTALSTAFTSGTPAASLLAGIYGGSGSNPGPGTSYGDLFGLGAWEGNVYAFERATGGKPPALISIDTQKGTGSPLPGTFNFTNGWSGAGVTTKVTIVVPPPPPVR